MKILVIGDSCIDRFVYGTVDRLTPEAPVPVLEVTHETTNGGMAENVRENLLNLGISTDIITNEIKSLKTRWVEKESNQMIMRSDESVESEDYGGDFYFDEYDAVVISDYDKGFLSEETIRRIAESHPLTFMDTKKTLEGDWFEGIKFIKINEKEYQSNERALENYPGNLIITLGSRGAMWNGEKFSVNDPSAVFDLTGAGDVFLASLVFKYVETKSIEESIMFANLCASKSVRKRGISIIDTEDL